jgi:hypothetical protein
MKLEVKLLNDFGISHFYLFMKTFIRERSVPISAPSGKKRRSQVGKRKGTVFPSVPAFKGALGTKLRLMLF